MDLYEKAKILAQSAHEGQVDKAGKDYFKAHILQVAKLVPDEPYLKEIALLHDTLEDTDITEEQLRQMFPNEIVDSVVTLTKDKNETYMDYIKRVKKDKRATKVKMCDLMQNMDLTRLNSINEKDILRVEKYKKALKELKTK